MKKYFKSLYNSIPFKKELFSVLKNFSIPEKVYKHLYFHGVMKVNIVHPHSFKMIHYGYRIENEIFWTGLYGHFEAQSLRVWTILCQSCNTIFDIGANTGIYSLVAKTINPRSQVHAFEPFESICDKLSANNALNNFNIHINCMAVSNYTGNGVIYSENSNFAYSVTVNKNLWVKNKNAIAINIKTITLKEYIDNQKIDDIDLMKIDVETHEPEVVEGFAQYLLKFQPIILIEVLTDEIAFKLKKYFSSDMFEFFNIDEINGLTKSEHLTKSKNFNYLIVPKTKVKDISQKLILRGVTIQ